MYNPDLVLLVGGLAMTHRAPLHRMRLEILNLHEHRLREYEAKLEAVAEQMKEPKVKEK